MVERLNPLGPLPAGGAGQPGRVTPPASPSVGPAQGSGTAGQPAGTGSFAQVLQQQLLQTQEGVRFSAHAQERLRLRQIQLSSGDLSKIDEGVRRAAAKGARESLLLSDKGAFVVSVRNRTVITVVDANSMKDNVFTNIDSAVIL